MFSWQLALLTVALAASTVGAAPPNDNTFIGCNTDPASGFSSLRPGLTGSPSACADACRDANPRNTDNDNFVYSYYKTGQLGYDCACISQAPLPSQGRDSPATPTSFDQCDYSTSYSVYRIRTAFVFTACYTGSNLENDGSGTAKRDNTDGNLNTAFTMCGQAPNVGYSILRAGTPNVYSLACGFRPRANAPTTRCGTDDLGNVYYLFTRDETFIYPTTYYKRAVRERMAKRGNQAVLFSEVCPKHMTACLVPGGSASDFECIDTSSDVDSCGGCLHGYYEPELPSNQTLGLNCLDLAGARSAACIGASCKHMACEAGYHLSPESDLCHADNDLEG